MGTTILRKREVRKRTGLSDPTIWRLEKKERFPRRVRLTDAGLVGWLEHEIENWIHARVRGGGKPGPKAKTPPA